MRVLALKDRVFLTGVLNQCVDCLKGKSLRRRIPRLSDYPKAKQLFERVFADLSGPYKVPAIGGFKYQLTLVDEFSRLKFTYLLKDKSSSAVYDAFILFHNEHVLPSGAKVHILRTDNGKEFVNQRIIELLCRHQIIREYTNEYTPQANAIVEVAIRELKRKAITYLNGANLARPHSHLWGEALKCATIDSNHSPNSGINMEIPAEKAGLRLRPLESRHVFGSVAVVIDEHRQHLEDKVVECVFVGYSSNKQMNSLRFYNLKTRSVIDSVNFKVIDGLHLFTKGKLYFDDMLIVETDDSDSDSESDTSSSTVSTIDGDLSSSSEDSSSTSSGGSEEGESEEGEQAANPHVSVNDDEDEFERTRVIKVFSLVRSKELEEYVIRRESLLSDSINSLFITICAAQSAVDKTVPNTYKQAVTCKDKIEWLHAMDSEFNSLLKNQTWDLVDPPKGANTVGSRWIYTIKRQPDGTIKRYKARLVCQGFTQTYGIDFFDVFSPTISSTTIRILLSLGCQLNWDFHQLDIETAFLNSPIEEDVYVKQAQGYVKDPSKVYKLNRSLYGLKQSPRNWHLTLKKVLSEDLDLRQSEYDPCLFYQFKGKECLYLIVYVDDLLITGSNEKWIIDVKKKLSNKFATKDLGRVNQLLGMVIDYDKVKGELKINQLPLIAKILEDYDVSKLKPTKVPASHDLYTKYVESVFNGDKVIKAFPYRSLIGSLMYLANGTRPDISNVVRFLSSFVTQFTDFHVNAALKVVKYLESTANLGLVYTRKDKQCLITATTSKFDKGELYNNVIEAYSDASWADDYIHGLSTTGFCIFLQQDLILWKSIKQRVPARSTMESEYIALSNCVDEVTCIYNILKEMQIMILYERFMKSTAEILTSEDKVIEIIDEAIVVHCDNEASIRVGNATAPTRRSRHINVDFHNVKRCVQDKLVKLRYVKSADNKADIFTKCLNRVTFLLLRNKIMGL